MSVSALQERAFALPFPEASVGRKLLVSVSGLFLIVFLLVHLGVNLTLFAGADTYNLVAHWMGTNPAILAMRPILALGVLVHVLVSLRLWLRNRRTRPVGYAVVDRSASSTWAARNMVVLGAAVLLFLALHVWTFSLRLTFGSPAEVEVAGRTVKDAYALVTGVFGVPWYAALYVAAIVLLGLHLSHALQSALQTLGLSDALWRRRWIVLGNLYAVLVTVGFAALPVFILVRTRIGGTP